jgi:phospho-N-acetylmuramoyl-pentapeptide-transferase
MLSELAQFEDYFGPLRLFRFISFRSVGGAATALLIGMFIAPRLIAGLRALKAGQSFRSREEVGRLAELHEGKRGTPTMGGLIIFISVTISTVLWAVLNVYIVTALLVYAGMTAIGFADDYIKVVKKSSGGLPGRYKLLGQAVLTAVALVILLNHPTSSEHIRQLWVPFYKEPVLAVMPLPLLAIFFFVVLSGSSNAINLTDGVDGLAIGCTVTVAMA